jgi:regulator of sigma E protease
MLDNVLNIALLALGFGFVIFWHELGHFLAAKWVGIKVEQFAVGFGQAVLAWRKGIGFRIGTTRPEYERRINESLGAKEKDGGELNDKSSITTEQFDRAGAALGMGETEYRLNWIPLGGYVKMLGQDDMNPNAISEDPRAYPQKSVGARMLVISAGVIMNIILAALLFMGLFTFGHKVPPAVVGGIRPGSPAQHVTYKTSDGKTATTSLQVGDEILYLDGKRQDDWTKVGLTTALADPDNATPITVRHVDGTEATYMIAPEKSLAGGGRGSRGFLEIGVEQPRSLQGPDPKKVKIKEDKDELRKLYPEDYFAVEPGDRIVAVDGQPVDPDVKSNDYYKLDRAVQEAGKAGGRPVKLTIEKMDGSRKDYEATPRFLPPFGKEPLNFAGMLPRTTVAEIVADSPAKDALRPGDVVVGIMSANDPTEDPTFDELTTTLNRAAHAGQPVELSVLRGDKVERLKLDKYKKVDRDRYGLGFGQGYDAAHAVVAGTLPDSPAAKAGIPRGAVITSVNGTKVANWFDVQRVLSEAPANQPIDIVAIKSDKPITAQLTLTDASRDGARYARYMIAPAQALTEQIKVRKADNPLQAAAWGVTETRDFILQFYVTIRRMFDGSVSYTNLMGPLGIFTAGTAFAGKGLDWLVWFLAMISANLAVVNFLPIPVVDGGHFVFLLLEKIQGKPVSQKMQSIAQVVGLALLLGVFLLVTYQDIMRMASPY